MNIYSVWLGATGYGADYAAVLLAKNIHDAVDYAFEKHFDPGDRSLIGYRARLVGVADPEFVGGDPYAGEEKALGASRAGDTDSRVVLVANAGG